ncbi:MAG: hypothetical protein WC005_10470, partial [Candidatus Nanopelagicales bacterium]
MKRTRATLAVILAVMAALDVSSVIPASAAQRTSTFIATPNGMVGVSQGLNVYLPSARGTNLS